MRVFTGTIPDYSTEVKGLLLSGVIGGGPAEQAGLQKGDVIVEIAGQTIANIYDYTYALEVLKIGEPAKVVYLRSGERKETTLTPARESSVVERKPIATVGESRRATTGDADDERRTTAIPLERCPRAGPSATAPRRS